MLYQAELLQLCLTLCDPMDRSPPGSSVNRIFQTRVGWGGCHIRLQGSSWPRDWTCISYISCISRQVLYLWRQLGSSWMLVLVLKCSREGKRIRRVFCNEILEMVSQMEIIKALWRERTLARGGHLPVQVLWTTRNWCQWSLQQSNQLPLLYSCFLCLDGKNMLT